MKQMYSEEFVDAIVGHEEEQRAQQRTLEAAAEHWRAQVAEESEAYLKLRVEALDKASADHKDDVEQDVLERLETRCRDEFQAWVLGHTAELQKSLPWLFAARATRSIATKHTCSIS